MAAGRDFKLQIANFKLEPVEQANWRSIGAQASPRNCSIATGAPKKYPLAVAAPNGVAGRALAFDAPKGRRTVAGGARSRRRRLLAPGKWTPFLREPRRGDRHNRRNDCGFGGSPRQFGSKKSSKIYLDKPPSSAYPHHRGGCLSTWKNSRCRLESRGGCCADGAGIPSPENNACGRSLPAFSGQQEHSPRVVTQRNSYPTEARKSFLKPLAASVAPVKMDKLSDIFIMRGAHIAIEYLQVLTAQYAHMRIFIKDIVAKTQHVLMRKVNTSHRQAILDACHNERLTEISLRASYCTYVSRNGPPGMARAGARYGSC